MHNPITGTIVHFNDVSSRDRAGNGDEGSAWQFGHCQLFPSSSYNWVRTGIQGCWEDEPLSHVPQERGFKNSGVCKEGLKEEKVFMDIHCKSVDTYASYDNNNNAWEL